MAQVGHPYSSQVKASQQRRLRALGAKPGKAWGNAASQQTTKYPTKNAGTERPLTISGGTAPKRADRSSNKYAKGGGVLSKGGKGKKKGSTTNIIIAPSGAGAAEKQPVPVPVPIRPPMGGPPPMGPRPIGVPPPGGIPIAGPAGPVGPMGPAAPPAMPPGARPPGMASGGVVKKAAGGFLKDPPGKTYRGFPHSPTTSVDDAVSAQKRGGGVKKKGYAHGGAVEESKAHERKESKAVEDSEAGDDDDGMKKGGSVKRAIGGPNGPIGGMGEDPRQGQIVPPARASIGRRPMVAPMMGQGAPLGQGGPGYKKGGKTKKHAGGGFVAKDQPSSEYHQQGVGYRARGGAVDDKDFAGQISDSDARRARVSTKGTQYEGDDPLQDKFLGKMGRKSGGGVMAGAGSGKGRLGKIAAAKAVPAKTEL